MYFKSHYVYQLSTHRQLTWSSEFVSLYVCRFLLYLEHKGQMICCTVPYLVRSYHICLVPLQKVVHTFLCIIKRYVTYPELPERTIGLTKGHQGLKWQNTQTFEWEDTWGWNNLANTLLAFLRKEKLLKTKPQHRAFTLLNQSIRNFHRTERQNQVWASCIAKHAVLNARDSQPLRGMWYLRHL